MQAHFNSTTQGHIITIATTKNIVYWRAWVRKSTPKNARIISMQKHGQDITVVIEHITRPTPTT